MKNGITIVVVAGLAGTVLSLAAAQESRERELHHRAAAELLEVERAAAAQQVRIGVTIGDVDEALAAQLGIDPERALLFTTVAAGQPADRAGVERHDILIGIGDEPLASRDALRERLRGLEPGDSLLLKVVRRGETLTIPVEVEAVEIAEVELPHARFLTQALKLQEHAAKHLEQLHRQHPEAVDDSLELAARYQAEIAELHQALAGAVDRLALTEERVEATAEEVKESVHAQLFEALHATQHLTAEDRAKIEAEVHAKLSEALQGLHEAGDAMQYPWMEIVERAGKGREALVAAKEALAAREAAMALKLVGGGGVGDIEGRLADIDKRLRAIEEMLRALLERSAGGARSSDVK